MLLGELVVHHGFLGRFDLEAPARGEFGGLAGEFSLTP
jgi:hypothetical protein